MQKVPFVEELDRLSVRVVVYGEGTGDLRRILSERKYCQHKEFIKKYSLPLIGFQRSGDSNTFP